MRVKFEHATARLLVVAIALLVAVILWAIFLSPEIPLYFPQVGPLLSASPEP